MLVVSQRNGVQLVHSAWLYSYIYLFAYLRCIFLSSGLANTNQICTCTQMKAVYKICNSHRDTWDLSACLVPQWHKVWNPVQGSLQIGDTAVIIVSPHCGTKKLALDTEAPLIAVHRQPNPNLCWHSQTTRSALHPVQIRRQLDTSSG